MSASIRQGLTLGALFGWLLSFPLFGPALFGAAADQAPQLGLLFLFSHGAGLLLLHFIPFRAAARRGLLRAAGALLALLTLLFLVPLPYLVAAVLFALMGFLAALLVLAWAAGFVLSPDRLTPIATAMAGANLVLALACVPAVPVWLGLPLLAGLALAAAVTLPSPAEERPNLPAAPLSRTGRVSLLLPLAAFAVGDYFVGGLWYSVVTASAASGWVWRPAAEALFSVAAIVLLAFLVRRPGPGTLARFSLSLMGLGLVLAATGRLMPVSRGLLLMGLVAGDLFYWSQLGVVGSYWGGRRTFGIGLGVSLWLIGLANLASAFGPQGAPGPDTTFLLTGAALLFVLLPLVYRLPAPEQSGAQGPAPTVVAVAAASPAIPDTLTPTERQVYELLLEGANDGEIAAALFVSRHTVKFHVRNILHKVGAANRKELLARLVVGQKAK